MRRVAADGAAGAKGGFAPVVRVGGGGEGGVAVGGGGGGVIVGAADKAVW